MTKPDEERCHLHLHHQGLREKQEDGQGGKNNRERREMKDLNKFCFILVYPQYADSPIQTHHMEDSKDENLCS